MLAIALYPNYISRTVPKLNVKQIDARFGRQNKIPPRGRSDGRERRFQPRYNGALKNVSHRSMGQKTWSWHQNAHPRAEVRSVQENSLATRRSHDYSEIQRGPRLYAYYPQDRETLAMWPARLQPFRVLATIRAQRDQQERTLPPPPPRPSAHRSCPSPGPSAGPNDPIPPKRAGRRTLSRCRRKTDGRRATAKDPFKPAARLHDMEDRRCTHCQVCWSNAPTRRCRWEIKHCGIMRQAV